MNNQLSQVKTLLTQLKLVSARESLDDLLETAIKENTSCLEFLQQVAKEEIEARNNKSLDRRMKQAQFPYHRTVKDFDFAFQSSITVRQFQQLMDMHWIEKAFNLLFLGPPGVGKTHLAVGLGIQAIDLGYSVNFVTMDEFMRVLKTADISAKSKQRFKRITTSDLVIIDEVGFLPISRSEANLFFQAINSFYQNISVIITSNKGFEEWAEFMDDPVITAAILRLVHNSEIFNMTGESYRVKNRNTIF